jgi:hypothetical protein
MKRDFPFLVMSFVLKPIFVASIGLLLAACLVTQKIFPFMTEERNSGKIL